MPIHPVRETISTMTNPELIERVHELRQRGRTSKEITRALGLPPTAVTPLIRAVAPGLRALVQAADEKQ